MATINIDATTIPTDKITLRVLGPVKNVPLTNEDLDNNFLSLYRDIGVKSTLTSVDKSSVVNATNENFVTLTNYALQMAMVLS